MKKIIVFGIDNAISKQLYFETQKYGEDKFAIEAFCVDKEYKTSDFYCGKKVLSLDELQEQYQQKDINLISTVLTPRPKMLIYDKLKGLGYSFANYISPLSDVCPDVKMGENNIIFSFSIVGFDVKLGNSNTIWNAVILDHNANVGSGNFFAGGSKMAGNVTVGSNCWIGTNSTIMGHLNIADETLIGAGATVIRDTQKCTTYVGVPAKAIGTHEETGIRIR